MKLKLLILTFVLAFGFAAAQSSSTSSDTQAMDMSQTLEELRQVYDHLGMIISQLEAQMGEAQMGSQTDADTGSDTMSPGQMRRDALRQASADLETLRGQLESGETEMGEAAAQELERIRSELSGAYAESGEADMQSAQDLDAQLGTLTEQLIDGRAEEYEASYAEVAGVLEEATRQAERQVQGEALEQAATDLEGLRGQIESGEADEMTADEVERVRGAISQAFEGADEESMQSAQSLDAQLGTLTEQLIDGRAEEYAASYAEVIEAVNTTREGMGAEDGN